MASGHKVSLYGPGGPIMDHEATMGDLADRLPACTYAEWDYWYLTILGHLDNLTNSHVVIDS